MEKDSQKKLKRTDLVPGNDYIYRDLEEIDDMLITKESGDMVIGENFIIMSTDHHPEYIYSFVLVGVIPSKGGVYRLAFKYDERG